MNVSRVIKPGDRFGEWTVLERCPESGARESQWLWLCQCSCGTRRPVRHAALGRRSQCCGRGCPSRRRAKSPTAPKCRRCGIDPAVSGGRLCQDCLDVRPYQRLHRRIAKYGLSVGKFLAKMSGQDGACSICERPFSDGNDFSSAFVDHDKVCGRLCQGCTSGLEFFRKDPEALFRAMLYLERFKANSNTNIEKKAS